jgi:hypothetical protein
METKTCSKCGKTKAIEEFYTKHGWPYSACKICHKTYVLTSPYYKEYQRKYHLKNRAVLMNKPMQRYRICKGSAKKRNVEFDITFEEFVTFWQKPCTYCGKKIRSIALDRTNNKEGYNISNVAPCCRSCNSTKGSGTVKDLLKRLEKKNVSNQPTK